MGRLGAYSSLWVTFLVLACSVGGLPSTRNTGAAPSDSRHPANVYDKMGFGQIREMAKIQAEEPGHAHMFNGFRLAGDFLHLSSFVFLLIQFRTAQSCSGISLKSQELYLLVFLTRYMDIFFNFISLYNTIMKLLFISATMYVIYMMRVELKDPTKEPHGTKISAALCGCSLLLALLYNDHNPYGPMWRKFVELAWTFSIYLEAVAIVPQMEVLNRAKVVKNLTANYLFALGAYRVFYLLNYGYRFMVDPMFSSREVLIKALGAVVQSALYVRFFMMYLESKQKTGVNADVVMNLKGIV
mmetsp:Transcript_24321/g.39194  ORF Transcript_24321/g.39194 Transcript_24321/m.39194 type:complete len:299 (-) Transcript_24321:136-1032(-)